MKNRRLFALGNIFLIMFNFFWLSFTLITPHIRNHIIPENISSNPNINIVINNNPEDFFEFYSNYKSNFAPLRIVTFIGQNNVNYDKNFAYLAAIPIGLYNENRVLKVSPILYDELSFAQEYFLVDWKNYCEKFDSWNGIKNIIYIGNVSTGTKNSIEGILNPEFDPIQFEGDNIYELTARLATYFWYRPDIVVITAINETFPDPHTILLNYSDILNANGEFSYKGEVNETYIENFWSNANLTLNTGGIFIQINNTDDLAMDLYGNFSESIPWMYDTNKISRNNWVFFPNVSYPADISDWGLRIYNTTQIASPIHYELDFFNLTYHTFQIPINNSECQFDVLLNWTNSDDDINFWLLDPSHQLICASSRTGNLYDDSEKINKSASILYPAKGNWTIIITRTTGITPILYDLTVNITEFASYRRQCIESAANGAILASLLNKPLLYVTNNSVPNATKQALTTFNMSKVLLVDPYNLMSEQVFGNLTTLNVNLTLSTNLTSRTMLYEYIYNITQEPDLVLSSINDGYFAPASLLAAYHGAPVSFTLNENYNIHAGALKNFATDYWIGFQNPGNSALLNQDIPRFQDMKGLADIFYSWLNTMNLDKEDNETVLVVSPITELNPFFDRAIYGKALVGRFAAQNLGDLTVFICRNILYPALSYSNLSYKFESQDKIVSCGGNSTITPIPLYATNYLGNYTACQFNDSIYHTYCNASNGWIIMAYYVNLGDSQIFYDNISQIEIIIEGKIGYSNASIELAGWGIWNWTSGFPGNYNMINTAFLNSTIDQFDKILIDNSNKSSFVSPTNSRIELFILVNTTGPTINVSIDLIQFNVTYDYIYGNPLMLASSITYWHDFSFQGNSYNFSSLIPLNFTQYGYQVENMTGYQEIYSQLADNCRLWYYSGNSTLPDSEFGNEGNILFTLNNYWRAYGDYNDNQGSTPDNPDADGDNIVTANISLGKWQTGAQINFSLSNIHSSFVLLQDSYLGATLIPEYLMCHGATVVIADLKKNVLGFSEYLSYIVLNELLKNKSLGLALYNAFKRTSHIYSQNWEGDIIGIEPFSNYTEENQQFILYGDPELFLINPNFDLPEPASYRPLIHGFCNYTFRTSIYWDFTPYDSQIFANITDLDSDVETKVLVLFNVTDTDYGYHEKFKNDQTNVFAVWQSSYPPGLEGYNFKGITRFHHPQWYEHSLPLESLGYKTFDWIIYDEKNKIQETVQIYLRSGIPTIDLSQSDIKINGTSIVHDPPDPIAHDVMGRVNESLFLRFCIQDWDQDYFTPDANELTINITFLNKDDSTSILRQLIAEPDDDVNDEASYWNITFTFDEFNTTGEYGIYCLIQDGEQEISDYLPYTPIIEYPWTANDIYRGDYYQFFYLINWIPEANGTNFVVTNGTGPEHLIFRVNETLKVWSSVFDIDGNQTHIHNATLCLYKELNHWINISMIDANFDNNWTSNYIFSPFDECGVWFPYIFVTDKDNVSILLQPNTNITVGTIPPKPIHDSLAIKNLSQIEISSVLRNETIYLYANATDQDVIDPTSNLTLYACLKDPDGIIRYQEVMTYDNVTNQWIYNFTPQTTDAIGNWTYYMSVWDEVNTHTNSSQELLLSFVNNIPVIQTVNVNPSSLTLNFGEPLRITGNVFDVEALDYIQIFIEDEESQSINLSQSMTGEISFLFEIEFNETIYSSLEDGLWNITIKLIDSDGNYTNDFIFDSQQNMITITVRPAQDDVKRRFPIEIIIIIAIVVTTVLATFLVYRTRKKEAMVIPAARVKQIIKRISKEKEEEMTQTRADIKARIKAIEIKPKTIVTPTPTIKKELTEEEKEKINQKLQDFIKEAQTLFEKNLFEEAAMTYHDAAKLASKLEKYEMARVYSDKGEEILQKGAEILKERKKQPKFKKKKKRKPEEFLSKVEIENVKSEISEIMRSARKAIREGDYISAAKQYQEVAKLYRKIQDEENALYFEEKADKLL